MIHPTDYYTQHHVVQIILFTNLFYTYILLCDILINICTITRAVMLLTADEPTEALMGFLSKRVTHITHDIFDVRRGANNGTVIV